MDQSANKQYANNDSEVCDFCGAEFKVFITKQAGHNEREEYDCPECGKTFSTRASLPPRVVLVKSRTDGRTEKYQNSEGDH